MNRVFTFSDKFQILLYALISVNLLITLYALFNCTNLMYDDIEHLKAAYFISSGDVPYRDFFEHHHALMWYLWAPIIAVLPHDTIFTLLFARIVSFGASVLSGCFLYGLAKRWLGGKTVALLFVCMFFWKVPVFDALYYVKPDTYMKTCFFAGLYYLLRYFENSRYKYLQVSSLCFLLSFLFLQSVVYQIIPLTIPVLYFIYRHPNRIKDFCFASIIPLVSVMLIGIYFFRLGILEVYWRDNWLFNTNISRLLHSYQELKVFVSVYKDILLLSTVALFFYLRRREFNIYLVTIGILLLFDLLQRLYYPSFIRYCVFLITYASLFCAPFVNSLIKDKRIFIFIFVGWSVFRLWAGVQHIIDCEKIQNTSLPYILEHYGEHTKSPYMFSGIYAPRLGYYWMYPAVEFWHNSIYKADTEYDINNIVKNEDIDLVACYGNCVQKTNLLVLAKRKRFLPDIPKQEEMVSKYDLSEDSLEQYEKIFNDLWVKKKK